MIYDILRVFGIITGYPFQLLFFKTKVFYENDNKKNRHAERGALIISNHYNLVDYIVTVFLFFPRKLYVVASEMAYRDPIISFGMKFWGGIQANRQTKNMRFVDISADKIRSGNLVLIFPEGHNTDDGEIHDFYPSYIKIALLAKEPIIPIITDGNYGPFKRTHVIIGEQIDLYDYLDGDTFTRDDIKRLNAMVYQKALDLKSELERRKNKSKRKDKN